MLKAILFDLDGVITDTAKFHFLAWKELAEELEIEIDEEFNEGLKGVDRYNSLLKILKHGNKTIDDEKIEKLMEKKNSVYLKMISTLTKNDILPGIENYILELRNEDIKIAIASASKNAPYILEKLGIIDLIDFIADPQKVKNSKPYPDIFLEAAKGVNVNIEECIGVEDSQAGIQSIKAAGCKSIGIGKDLIGSDLKLNDTKELSVKVTKELHEK